MSEPTVHVQVAVGHAAITLAALTLFGVVVGGVISTRRESWFRRRAHERERRRAARLLVDELMWFASGVGAMVKGDQQGLADPQPLINAWTTEQDALRDLSADEWQELANAVREAREGQRMKLRPDETASLKKLSECCTSAAQRLTPYLEVPA